MSFLDLLLLLPPHPTPRTQRQKPSDVTSEGHQALGTLIQDKTSYVHAWTS